MGEQGTTLAVTSNCRTLRREKNVCFTRAIRSNIPEDDILNSHRRENFTFYISTCFYLCQTEGVFWAGWQPQFPKLSALVHLLRLLVNTRMSTLLI
jgi:hypothetical protein